MANQQTNRLNVVLSTAAVAQIKQKLQEITALMPFLLGITIEERMSMPKISVSNKIFTEDAVNIAQNNGGILPAFVNSAHISNDYNLFNQLDELLPLFRQLIERMEDTQMLAGSEAYMSALVIYKLAKAAADAGVPGADAIAEHLSARFNNSGASNVSTAPPINPSQPT